MSRPRGGPMASRRQRASRRAAAVAIVVPLLASGAVGLVSAERGSSDVRLVARGDLHPAMVEVRPGAGAPGRLLAVAPDGGAAAIADRIAADRATLSVARRGGLALEVALPGLIDAAFAPDGSWLAVLDGAGSLWRVGDGGTAARLASGPFLGPLTVEAGGTVLLSVVSSVEAPFSSRLARFDPAGSALSILSDEPLVYGSTLLADGSIAIVAHRPGGTVVRRVVAAGPATVEDLGRGAIHVSVAGDGRTIAFERYGDGVYLRDVTSGATRRIAAGTRPRLAPDGRVLLVERDGGTAVLALDGSVLAHLAGSHAGFAGCAGECGP